MNMNGPAMVWVGLAIVLFVATLVPLSIWLDRKTQARKIKYIDLSLSELVSHNEARVLAGLPKPDKVETPSYPVTKELVDMLYGHKHHYILFWAVDDLYYFCCGKEHCNETKVLKKDDFWG